MDSPQPFKRTVNIMRIAPTFFTAAGVAAAGGVLANLGSAFLGRSKDNAAAQKQRQDREIAARQQEQAAGRVQQAGQQQLSTQESTSRQRVEALDRIIGAFRQNLRIK